MAKKKRNFNPYGMIQVKIRNIWLWSPSRKEALNRAKVYEQVINKNGSISKRRSCIGYRCEKCGKVIETTKDVQVHHVNHVGNMLELTISEIIEKMFCPSGDLMILCKECHLEEHPERKQKRGKKKNV